MNIKDITPQDADTPTFVRVCWLIACVWTGISALFLFVALFEGSFWGIHVVALCVMSCGFMTFIQPDTSLRDVMIGMIFIAVAILWWTIAVKWPLYFALIVIGSGLADVYSDEENGSHEEA